MAKLIIDPEALLKFIAKAHRHTYAAPKEVRKQHKCATPILPGHKDYHFVDGVWAYHDSYAGNDWAPGREVVFLNDNPVWAMSYQGKPAMDLGDQFFQERAFPFLREALMNFKDELPFRGPGAFEKTLFKYEFRMEGDYDYFTGRERVLFDCSTIFFQDVMGELIK